MSDIMKCNDKESIEHQLSHLKLCIARIAQSAGLDVPFLKDEKLLDEALHNFSDDSQWISLCAWIRLEFDKIQAEKEK